MIWLKLIKNNFINLKYVATFQNYAYALIKKIENNCIRLQIIANSKLSNQINKNVL